MVEHKQHHDSNSKRASSTEGELDTLFAQCDPVLIDYGESAIVIELHARDSVQAASTLALQHVFWQLEKMIKLQFTQASRSLQNHRLEDVVLGNQNLTLIFDPLRTDRQLLRQELLGVWDTLRQSALSDPSDKASEYDGEPRRHLIEVLFNEETGPDLAALAAATNNSVETLIVQFCAADYRVLFTGFLPGFAYMSGLPAALVAERRSSPRREVPAGSIAIGGQQVGIYPQASPGGWQIIGRVADQHLPIFDSQRSQASLFAAADYVRFTLHST